MSEQEFEVYLRLIARLLRLSEAQRESISDELRDHMEARLDELMTEGLSREQAIHTAVEEFGDAAGLADQFTRITRQHNLRRRIMRTSIGALAAAAAIALAFLYMLPQNRPGVPGPSGIHASETGAGGELPNASVVTAGEADPTLERFSQRISANFQDNRLAQVIDYLRNTTGVNIFVNWTVLQEVGADQDTPVSLTLEDTPADTVLLLVFQLINPTLEQPLDYVVIDGVVVIASEQDIDEMRVVRIYDCIDLIDRAGRTATADASTFGGEGRMSGNGMGMAGVYGAEGGYGMDGGGYGDAYAAEAPSRSAGRRAAAGSARPVHAYADELMDVMSNLLDDGNAGSVSVYDDMLIVIAGHKTHQRIQETLVLLRGAQAQRE